MFVFVVWSVLDTVIVIMEQRHESSSTEISEGQEYYSGQQVAQGRYVRDWEDAGKAQAGPFRRDASRRKAEGKQL